MTAINSFYSGANALQYATQLFSTRAPANGASASAASTYGAPGSAGWQGGGAERALARIIEILALGSSPDSAANASVSETMGHITGTEGTANGDKLTIRGRSATGLDMGAGDDTVTVKAAMISALSGGEGNDTINLSGQLVNDIHGDAGDDTITIASSLVLDVDGGEGDDRITIAAKTIRGVTGGAGDDTMILEGNRIFVSGGTGNDTVTIKQTGRSAVAEYGFAQGDGSDTIASNGALSIRFTGIAEDDVVISVSGDTLTAKVKGTDDALSVTLTGGDASRYQWVLDGGNHVLKIG